MVSTGSSDQPGATDGHAASFTGIVLRNLDIGPNVKVGAGVHMDHLWIGPGHDPFFKPDVLIEDVYVHDSNGGVMPILWEANGGWGNVTLRRFAMVNVAHPITIKCDNTSFASFTIEDSPGVRIIFQGVGPAFTVTVRNRPGIEVSTPRDGDGPDR